MNCGECKKKILREDVLKIKCHGCSVNFHGGCVNVGKQDIATLQEEGLTWSCTSCKARRLSFMRDDAAPASPSIASLAKGLSELRAICEPFAALGKEVKDLKILCETKFGRLDNFFEEFQDLVREKNELKNTVEQLRSENDKLREITARTECEVAKLEKQVVELRNGHPDDDCAELKQQCAILEKRVQESDRIMSLESIEIHGIPSEIKGNRIENAMEILSETLSFKIDTSDIHDCVTVRKKGAGKTKGAKSADATGESLWIIRLADRAMRRKVMEAVRARRREMGGGRLKCKFRNGLVFGVSIYERITATTRALLSEAREIARERNWRYVWIREGKVFARRINHGRVVAINSPNDLEKMNNNDDQQ